MKKFLTGIALTGLSLALLAGCGSSAQAVTEEEEEILKDAEAIDISLEDIMTVHIDDITITIPCAVTDVQEAGFETSDIEVEPHAFSMCIIDNGKDENIALEIMNNTSKTAKAEECIVTGIYYNEYKNGEHSRFDIDGITAGMSRNTIEEILGEADSVIEQNNETILEYNNSLRGYYITFENNLVSNIYAFLN